MIRVSWALLQSKGNGARGMNTKTLARTFQTIYESLDFYENNTGLSVSQLEPVLSQIGFLQGKTAFDLFSDDRFRQLLLQASSEMDSCDSSVLGNFSLAISKLAVPREGCEELTGLAQRIGEVATKRLNAFSPTSLSHLALGMGTRGVTDPQLIEFLRIEATKMMSDFSPDSAILLLEAFRRMSVFNRELVDNVVERLTDTVDRFTSRDIVNCVSVLSKLSLGRGYLLRRLSNLSFENLSLFNHHQLVKLFSSFSSLRFVSIEGADKLMAAMEPLENKLSRGEAIDCLFALASVDPVSRIADRLISIVKISKDQLTLSSKVNLAWSLVAMEKEKELLEEVANEIFSGPPPGSRVLLLKALEVANNIEGVVSVNWKAAMDEAEKLEVGRFEQSKLHSEVLALVEAGKEYVLQRTAKAGPYRVEFLDENEKLVIDIDTLSRPTRLSVKHKQLRAEGFHTVGVNYWELRRFKNFEGMQEYLKRLIVKAKK